jgi:hypothetical protein
VLGEQPLIIINFEILSLGFVNLIVDLAVNLDDTWMSVLVYVVRFTISFSSLPSAPDLGFLIKTLVLNALGIKTIGNLLPSESDKMIFVSSGSSVLSP